MKDPAMIQSASRVSDPPAAPVILPAPIIPVLKQTHRNSKRATPDSLITDLKSLCIYKGPMKRKQLRKMHILLQSTGLLTMLLRQRSIPEMTDDNPLGYRDASVIHIAPLPLDDTDSDIFSVSSSLIPESQVIALSEDDIGLFLHDKARLMVVLPIMFHVSYHSHGEANLLRIL